MMWKPLGRIAVLSLALGAIGCGTKELPPAKTAPPIDKTDVQEQIRKSMEMGGIKQPVPEGAKIPGHDSPPDKTP
ncbi:MAG: hypothetical protein ACKV0T_08620 [Planctomycetales bacterium]